MQTYIARKNAVLILCTAWAGLLPGPAQSHPAEPGSLWGGLRPGPYYVGFRSYFKFDHGRRDRQLSTEEQQRVAKLLGPQKPPLGDLPRSNQQLHKGPNFRPVLVALWYPAAGTAPHNMRLRDYLDFPQPGYFADFAGRLRKFGELTAKRIALRKEERSMTVKDDLAFDQLLETETRAYRNAPNATGHFPVVIYHPGAGGSFDENWVLFEFLASNGYVVISSAYQTSTVQVSNNVGRPARSIRDMQFLLEVASELPFVDLTRVVGIGHSAGAHVLMHWIGEGDCPLVAMVSIDSTLEYTPRNFSGHKQLRQALENLDSPEIPIMLFASTEKNPDFSTMDRFLRHAPRYEVLVSHLRHDEYISHGAMRAALEDTRVAAERKPAAIMRQNYDQVCITIDHFLRAVLGSDEKARTALRDMTRSGTSLSPVQVRYKARR